MGTRLKVTNKRKIDADCSLCYDFQMLSYTATGVLTNLSCLNMSLNNCFDDMFFKSDDARGIN